MMPYPLEKVKGALSWIGQTLSPRSMYIIESAFNYLSVGHWIKIRGFRATARFGNRYEAFRLAGNLIGERKVLYLEFGVWKGDSIRFWSKLLTNPESLLHGFDSFEGLPDDWSSAYRKGSFSVGGNIPDTSDPRVRFFKGWFKETLPRYEIPEHEIMFVNCDADLYSSTKTVLDYIGPSLRAGDYLYFDEFHHADGERRAFDEFLLSSGLRFSLIGCSGPKSQVLFVTVKNDPDCQGQSHTGDKL
jgi:hypothetical protein